MASSGHILSNLTEATYGQIPQQLINEKYRESSYFHDPEAIKNYQMDILKVFGTEKPFSEQDRIRENSQTRNIIDLRIRGSRYGSTRPDHSEINFELTEKDPRGNYNLPKFEQFREQSEYRKRKWEYQFAKDGGINYTEKRIDPYEAAEKDQERRHRWKQMLTIFSKARVDNPRSVHVGYTHSKPAQDYVTHDNDKELLKKFSEKEVLPSRVFIGNNEPKFGMGTVVDHYMTESGIGLLRQVKLHDYKAPISDADVDNKFTESMSTITTRAKILSMKQLMRIKAAKGLTNEDLTDITTTGTLSHNKAKLLSDEERKQLKAIKLLHDASTQSMRDGYISKGRKADTRNIDIRNIDKKISEDSDRSSSTLTRLRKNKLFEKTRSDIGKTEIKTYGQNKETINYKTLLHNGDRYRAKHYASDERNGHINAESNNVIQKQNINISENNLDNYDIETDMKEGFGNINKRSFLVERSRNDYDNVEYDDSGFFRNEGNRHGMSYASNSDGSLTANKTLLDIEDKWEHG